MTFVQNNHCLMCRPAAVSMLPGNVTSDLSLSNESSKVISAFVKNIEVSQKLSIYKNIYSIPSSFNSTTK